MDKLKVRLAITKVILVTIPTARKAQKARNLDGMSILTSLAKQNGFQEAVNLTVMQLLLKEGPHVMQELLIIEHKLETRLVCPNISQKQQGQVAITIRKSQVVQLKMKMVLPKTLILGTREGCRCCSSDFALIF